MIFFSLFVDPVWIPIVAALLLFLVFALVVVCCIIKKFYPIKREGTKLPKSLVIYLDFFFFIYL